MKLGSKREDWILIISLSFQYCKWTAIFFAVKNKDQDTVKLLIEREAILSIKDEVCCDHT